MGKNIFNTHIEIDVMSEEESLDMTHIVMKLSFDNPAYIEEEGEFIIFLSCVLYIYIYNLLLNLETKTVGTFNVTSDMFFDVFPFHLLFDKNMCIKNMGK